MHITNNMQELHPPETLQQFITILCSPYDKWGLNMNGCGVHDSGWGESSDAWGRGRGGGVLDSCGVGSLNPIWLENHIVSVAGIAKGQ